MSERDSNGFMWFIGGLAAGAVLGVLYAPQSGEETRDALRVKAEEGRERIKERARQAQDTASDWADRGKDALHQQKDQIRSAFEAGRSAYKEATTGSEGGV